MNSRFGPFLAPLGALAIVLGLWIGWSRDDNPIRNSSTTAQRWVNGQTGSPVRTNLHRGDRSQGPAQIDPLLAESEQLVDDDDDEVDASSIAASLEDLSRASTYFIVQMTAFGERSQIEPTGSRFLMLLRIRC